MVSVILYASSFEAFRSAPTRRGLKNADTLITGQQERLALITV